MLKMLFCMGRYGRILLHRIFGICHRRRNCLPGRERPVHRNADINGIISLQAVIRRMVYPVSCHGLAAYRDIHSHCVVSVTAVVRSAVYSACRDRLWSKRAACLSEHISCRKADTVHYSSSSSEMTTDAGTSPSHETSAERVCPQ